MPMESTVTESELGSREPIADSPEILQLFSSHLELVNKIASVLWKHVEYYAQFDDLVSAGREGLLLAARRFEASRGVPFHAYANYRVRGSIIDAIRKAGPLPRRVFERLQAMDCASLVSEGEAMFTFSERNASLSDAEAEDYLDEHLASIVTATVAATAAQRTVEASREGDFQKSPEEAYAEAELLDLIRRTLGQLDDIEGKIVEYMYFEGLNLEQVAKRLGMGKPWACRLHTRAMDRLTKLLRRVA